MQKQEPMCWVGRFTLAKPGTNVLGGTVHVRATIFQAHCCPLSHTLTHTHTHTHGDNCPARVRGDQGTSQWEPRQGLKKLMYMAFIRAPPHPKLGVG